VFFEIATSGEDTDPVVAGGAAAGNPATNPGASAAATARPYGDKKFS
jgi:hypothetical protein